MSIRRVKSTKLKYALMGVLLLILVLSSLLMSLNYIFRKKSMIRYWQADTMHKGTVKIELLNRKVYRGKVYEEGTLHNAMIRMDGWAVLQVFAPGNFLVGPNEYRLYIPDQAYDELLK